jgi:glycosyltransferase involved in cell wall biosynthesis
VRVLFFNEGNLGTYILGQSQGDDALRAGLSAAPEVQARFVGLTPMGRWTRAAAMRSTPRLASMNLDFRTLRWHLVQSLRARAQLRAELRRWPADVVHVHTQSIALTMSATMRALPVVLSIDSTVYSWSAMPAWPFRQSYAELMLAPSRALERRALRGAALVLAFTDWARRSAEHEAPGARVITHHPGIDLRRYRPAERRERALPRVLFVGGRFAAKGGEDLLEAVGDALGRELELDIVTPEQVPARPGMRVHRLSQADPQLLDLQQQADVMCLPTYGDTNPWALLEAMACGTPVISTPVGGIPDMLDRGRAGVLVPYGDPRTLGEAIRALLADPDRRAQLADRARVRCEEHFDATLQFAKLAERLARLGDDQAGVPRRSNTRRSSTPSARSPNSSAG